MLEEFFFKESPIYYRSNRTVSRWFVYFYRLLTCLYLVGTIAGLVLLTPNPVIGSFVLILRDPTRKATEPSGV